VKEAEANEQHKSIISALKAAAPEWEFEQINFVVGNCGSVLESDFYTKLKKLDIQEGINQFLVIKTIIIIRCFRRTSNLNFFEFRFAIEYSPIVYV